MNESALNQTAAGERKRAFARGIIVRRGGRA
ncbi:hypothetical protein BN439_0990 [Erwinia amylovora Ea644]|uniref:Uncharacterized protein n=3 Tax=Erwinia amylovora TaxID=552 RepID=A0A830ZZ12_ERWAM|nr:hypothetical protein EaACW_0731 [Erwinia amylovora ACW56400]QJQ55555.1 hypothetical protein EHX00_2855 [Erwinia amylovora]CBA19674.1 hypothetical protein predicted by Glimmer/Critica [Erwinia amylovora CFBP1430]CBX79570.1 hypothetical protein predicted by Glimmer/Critica [Erwinia amylovora ATCC BAA-2158]CCO77578.1 hypothetical protein BN432_0751 [Erwinia amylovora Ea356]CCO81362.1 hypothetical protein BN433_0761 [Erwinia amylovora Ea266]CCO85166.1 hypothetical protein BN434_0749 [Erwinia a